MYVIRLIFLYPSCLGPPPIQNNLGGQRDDQWFQESGWTFQTLHHSRTIPPHEFDPPWRGRRQICNGSEPDIPNQHFPRFLYLFSISDLLTADSSSRNISFSNPNDKIVSLSTFLSWFKEISDDVSTTAFHVESETDSIWVSASDGVFNKKESGITFRISGP